MNTNGEGAYLLGSTGNIGDGGYGYGLTIGANSNPLGYVGPSGYNNGPGGTNDPVFIEGTNTFTRPHHHRCRCNSFHGQLRYQS